jgi:hypothetical protein
MGCDDVILAEDKIGDDSDEPLGAISRISWPEFLWAAQEDLYEVGIRDGKNGCVQRTGKDWEGSDDQFQHIPPQDLPDGTVKNP